ncbi:putative copper homeostasis (lipo)protein LpqS [Nocardia sp. IFM 10818]
MVGAAPQRRRPAVAVAVVTALLVVLLADCTLFRSEGHAHTAGTAETSETSVLAAIGLAEGGSVSETAGEIEDCTPHLEHCVKSALPGAGGITVSPLPILLLLAIMLPVAAGILPGVPGVRGPPGPALPVVGGRMLLTRICIARR